MKAIKFLKEARSELRKVTWPTWDDITRSTVVVFFMVLFFTIFIYFIDNIVNYVISKILT